MDGLVEISGMDNVQDASPQGDSEEKAKAAASGADQSKPTPQGPKAGVEKKAGPVKPAVGTSAGAKTKTVASEPPPDPINAMRRRVIWTSVGGFLATCFLM